MKQAKHNEIDLLLRSLAKGGKSSSVLRDPAPEDRTLAQHMDADELISYAERVLPAAARARYTAHLSDCASCRKTVTQLTPASGISIGKDMVEQPGRAPFWQQLGALFSPRVLRYAIPALALFAVIGVSLVALREKPEPQFVAQNHPSISTAAPTETRHVDSRLALESASKAASIKEKSGESNSATGRQGDTKRAGRENEQAQNSDSVDSSLVTAAKDSPSEKSSAAAAQPSFAPEPAAPPPPKPQGSVTAATRTEELAKQKEVPAGRDASPRQQGEERARTKDETAGVYTTQSKAQPAGALGSVQGNRTNEVRRLDAKAGKKGDDDAETRTVAGRRFRRQGNAWVDAAYDSSSAVTNISRGSEQYRALVADEPGIRTIAEQLHGEVVLVWKGRAYRIR